MTKVTPMLFVIAVILVYLSFVALEPESENQVFYVQIPAPGVFDGEWNFFLNESTS